MSYFNDEFPAHLNEFKEIVDQLVVDLADDPSPFDMAVTLGILARIADHMATNLTPEASASFAARLFNNREVQE